MGRPDIIKGTKSASSDMRGVGDRELDMFVTSVSIYSSLMEK